ncbi:hypothetical protein N0V88_006818 [Collariella sp. IMI 366227]|nr:hypothetical protein N0V88_006818 [Collariella sp. IMI 366227]
MAEISEGNAFPGPNDIETPGVKPNALVREYLLERLPIYRDLHNLQKQGWESEAGDTYFQNQRQRADHPNFRTEAGFFMLMHNIGIELNKATAALTIQNSGNPRPAILDLCMAPGGFSSAALSYNRSALLRAISLPPAQGGHKITLKKPWSSTNPEAKIFVSFRDITFLADEMETPVSSIPASHPDFASFSSDRPFLGQEFDLVFCDGQVLRTHERLEYRENSEATRLLTSQLVLGLQRIQPGGSMVILLHKANTWSSVLLMHTFTLFSDSVELFKPRKAHRTHSSFYLVAKGVRPRDEAAVEAVRQWKVKWNMATFGVVEGREDGLPLDEGEVEVLGSGEEKVRVVLKEFGPALVRMAEPVFEIQAEALRNAPWMRSQT